MHTLLLVSMSMLLKPGLSLTQFTVAEFGNKGEAYSLTSIFNITGSNKDLMMKLLDSVPVGISIASDISCRKIRHNRKAAEFFRIKPWESLSFSENKPHPVRPFHHGKELSPDEMPIQRAALYGEEVKGFEIEFIWDDGLHKISVWNSSPFINGRGNIIGAIASFEDITEKKKPGTIIIEKKLLKDIVCDCSQGLTVREPAAERPYQSQQREVLLSTVASRLLTSEDPQNIIDELCHKTMEHLGYDVFFNYMVNQERGCLRLNACAGIPQEEIKKLEWLDFGVAVCGCAAKEGCCIIAEDIPATPDPRTELLAAYGLLSYACHPLKVNGQVIGTLAFGSRSRKFFNEDELAMMKTVSDHIAIAMSRLLVNRQLEELVRARTRKLNEVSDRLIQTIESITDAFFTFDTEWRVTYWNAAAEKMFNLRRQDIVGKNFWEVFPESVAEFYHQYHLAVRENIPVKFETMVSYTGRWVEARAYPSRQGLTIYLNDISERKHAEEELHKSRREIIDILESIGDGFIALDKNLRYTYVNHSAEKAMSLPREAVLGIKAENLLPDVLEKCRQVIRERKPQQFIFYSELFKKWFDTKVYPAKNGVSIFFQDITERKRLEREMARLDQLHLIGEMAAGIGHEVRNPMTTVKGFLQLLSRNKDLAKYIDRFNLMIEELDRINSIITQFLSLAKNKAVEKKKENIKTIVEVFFPLIQADAIKQDKNIEIRLDEVPEILLDEKEFRQMLLNLVRNGLEAMPPGGKITIKLYAQNGEVILAVQDEGHGIPAEILDKIGTPFLTTKDKGTGLGLAVCYSIANRHNAVIDIDTGPEGTTFFVRFKAC